jgi:hypothetical protein
MEFLNLLLVDLWGFLAAALEHPGSAFKQGPLPLMDHRRMHTEPARQLGYRLFTLQRFKRPLRLELRPCCFRFDISDLLLVEDQQTTYRSLRQCPNFGE